MTFDSLRSPAIYLRQMLGTVPHEETLQEYETWWEKAGQAISHSIDRAGTPWLRMFDPLGKRVDEILYPPEYWQMLKRGYQAGVIWRAFEERSLLPSYLLGYVTSFYDPGLYCPYTVSLSTAAPLDKYGSENLKARFLPQMLRKDEAAWQGATWMTEIKGGSDLGAAVETVAKPAGDKWLLNGEKYFSSNVGAELAVVAARPEGAPENVRGLALFLLPKYREDGHLNYFIRRIKDKIGTRSVPTGEVELKNSEAYLLGKPEWGIYLILEVLNLSRVANSIASVALAQRAMSDALNYAEGRTAFGKPVIEHPLLRKQFEDRFAALQAAFALGWESVQLLNEVWRETPPYSDRYHLFRLVAHFAKYWTAEFAAQTSKWAMEVYGGIGTLAEYHVERWLREAMILQIWEGTPHRQILDGLEVMQRKAAHRLLFQHLAPMADSQRLQEMTRQVEKHLVLSAEAKEAQAEKLFQDLAQFTASALLRKMQK
ncbi:acyl-CoA dehydrogenase family protein [candidate division KSB1 bacterium]|nr:acyl-CoA dehydrogenase family protein [candidate division KSB1 bacterium]